MARSENEEAFLRLVAQSFGVDQNLLSLEQMRDQLDDWDSLNHIMLFMALEREYGVKFSTEDLEEYDSLEQIYTRLNLG
jgi:acyl carrier protein